ncbi:MAG: SCO family protein [Flavobacteriaceae bacterium]|nr:MAG: SCO family protein [Flavobacteriaceae bacterium]
MNLRFFKKSLPTFIFLIVFSIVGITVFFHILKTEETLTVFNPSDVNPRLVDASVKHIRNHHTIADFSLINQNGEPVTHKDYEGKIYIADFFFTRCQSICITMAYHMQELQEYYKNDDEIMFLSHSVTPGIDSVPVLKAYAIEKGVNDIKWNVATGSKKHIYDLARKSYFTALDEGESDENDFIHTEQFVLIDKKRCIRGFYDGTKKEDMEKIKTAIALLKKEYAKK